MRRSGSIRSRCGYRCKLTSMCSLWGGCCDVLSTGARGSVERCGGVDENSSCSSILTDWLWVVNARTWSLCLFQSNPSLVRTRKVSGPSCFSITPGTHGAPCRQFRTITGCPTPLSHGNHDEPSETLVDH